MFVDEVTVHAAGGRGGSGVTSFLRQAYEPKGPPDGGDGGHGGSVRARATENVRSLVDYHHRPHRRAERGRHGQGDRKRGADGEDVVLAVPVGTVVRDRDDGALLGDLVRPGDEVVIARGGRGGRGNAAFRTQRRRSPGFHELGEPAEERSVVLELKLVVDVALVGYPNAGKSSLIARLSAAKPKIADYPFTTLVPNLGVVRTDPVDIVVADVPGLIPGASDGRGLGHDFLRHVERARVLVHVLDCASWEQRDPREDLAALTGELRAYRSELLDRPALVALNKVDADPETAEIVRPDLEEAGWEVLEISAVTGQGTEQLARRMAELVAASPSQEAEVAPEPRPVLRPTSARDDLEVETTKDGFRVVSPRVDRWVAMTDLDNEEAVAHLQQRLARAGVERALVAAGARAGDPVEIGGIEFDFSPELADLPADERAALAAELDGDASLEDPDDPDGDASPDDPDDPGGDASLEEPEEPEEPDYPDVGEELEFGAVTDDGDSGAAGRGRA
ncbi:GTPase ObgE [Egibacter rhizosphaerae]|uniref:GTPase Obg n=1 Tax=Egibacter rhizosphaerae TaxID=1670831 RepID=A0A411YBM2_9ACTN|nr:GTPase ObgE [Egibacter rhizosphaerae]QBI18653.1 GTPase ObgE [Egibacter rhizosphaerae]